jgi:alpha-galactosidase
MSLVETEFASEVAIHTVLLSAGMPVCFISCVTETRAKPILPLLGDNMCGLSFLLNLRLPCSLSCREDLMIAATPNRRKAALQFFLFFFTTLILCRGIADGQAQSAGIADRPYLGWSSFSEQTVLNSFLTQTNIQAQSDALLSSGLQAHGFTYINIDVGWQGNFDSNGRPTPNTALFPNMAALIAHIHQNGQKAGIYWTPGVDRQAVIANSQILGTACHIRDILVVPNAAGDAFAVSDPIGSLSNFQIDFSKPGAQEYVDSIVDLFTSWGVDFIKLNGVTPGSSTLSIDNEQDVVAWSKAIAKSGRPIWLTISWAVDQDYFNTWEQYSNARRIDDDIECNGACSTLTDWALTSQRWSDLIGWQTYASSQTGWNDLGPLEVGNSFNDGVNAVEQQSAITLWAMANAPLYLGGDLTALDATGIRLLSNDEVLAVDQSGHPASQIAGGMTPVWVSDLGDGSYYVALFNLNAFPAPVTVKWGTLGFTDASNVRDLWNHRDLGRYDEKFSALILGHGARLTRVFGRGVAEPEIAQPYEAEFGMTSGQTAFTICKLCSAGREIIKLGLDKSNTVTLNDVHAEHAGTFRMEVNAATSGPRDLFYQVNNGVPTALKIGGGSFNLPSTTVIPVTLLAGDNTIQFGNPTGIAPNLDRIAIIGEGGETPLPFAVYDAEIGSLSGTTTHAACEYCSGNTKIIGLGEGSDNVVTIPDISVAGAGLYQMEVDYLTKVPRSLFMTVNDDAPIQLSLTGDSEVLPTSVVIPVALKGGKNKIQFSNQDNQAPALDKIAIGPTSEPWDLTLGIRSQTGTPDYRSWVLDLANWALTPAEGAELDLLSLVQVSGQGSCQPKVLANLPITVGTIPKQKDLTLTVPIDFSACSNDARFNASIVYSSNNGAVVGDIIDTDLSQ